MLDQLYTKFQNEFNLISGPCVIESEKGAMEIAEKLVELTAKHKINYVFKASFDKANRTSLSSYRGPGLEKGIEILAKIKKEFNVPITTDIHEPFHAKAVAEVVDILQIPAFLCRQTDLLVAAAETNKIVNIKKAQFLTGEDMFFPAEKVRESGNSKIMLCERGTSFGNHNLVVDYRNVIEMQKFGYPVVMDVTHSTQKPGSEKGKSGGKREYAPYIANAAAAVGVKNFFFETHLDPDNALSDGPNMIKFSDFEKILLKLLEFVNVAHS